MSARRRHVVPAARIAAVVRALGGETVVRLAPDGSAEVLTGGQVVRLRPAPESASDPYAPLTPDAP